MFNFPKDTTSALIESAALVTKLQAELEAARAEIERKMSAGQFVLEQLAAEQAKNVELREALHYSLGAWHYDGVSDEHGSIFKEANDRCDAPSDTSALEAIVKKVGEVMRERCADKCNKTDDLLDLLADAIRALPVVTLEDLK